MKPFPLLMKMIESEFSLVVGIRVLGSTLNWELITSPESALGHFATRVNLTGGSWSSISVME